MQYAVSLLLLSWVVAAFAWLLFGWPRGDSRSLIFVSVGGVLTALFVYIVMWKGTRCERESDRAHKDQS